MRHRGSISGERKQSTTTIGRFRSNSNLTQVPTADSIKDGEIVHSVEPKASTAVLPPVMSKSIDEHPLCWLGFEAESIITSCKDGKWHTFTTLLCCRMAKP